MVHFTVEQRYKLEVLLQQNVCKEQIAIELGKHISSVYRELKRNTDERNTVYKANLASRKCKKGTKKSLRITVLI
ncbi:helix-turn-helix domain-containing protein [uncultured Flavobacterium sp.]|uniref:helix-turn-helix domain-containing protein n=1 Tax=uncultured Flavobacterium sp. TaxID=165435 RepID=UPI0030CA54B9